MNENNSDESTSKDHETSPRQDTEKPTTSETTEDAEIQSKEENPLKMTRETSPSYTNLEIGDSKVEIYSAELDLEYTPENSDSTINIAIDEPSTSKNVSMDHRGIQTFFSDDSTYNTKEESLKTTLNATNENKENNNVLGKCSTVKEILTEILDCTIVRNTDKGNVSTTKQPTSSTFGMQCTVKDILGELLNFTICRRNTETCDYSEIQVGANATNVSVSKELDEPSTSKAVTESKQCQSELGLYRRDFQLYSALNIEPINSESALENLKYVKKTISIKSFKHLLPSYSTVIKMGPPPPPPTIRTVESSGSFVARPPPPTYAEVEGIWEDRPSIVSSESMIFGPDPLYMVCPRCRIVVVTEIERENSNMTHMVALVLCLFFCWPCVFIPYCLKSCSYTYHSCPNCHHYFGMYRPF